MALSSLAHLTQPYRGQGNGRCWLRSEVGNKISGMDPMTKTKIGMGLGAAAVAEHRCWRAMDIPSRGFAVRAPAVDERDVGSATN